MWLLRAFASNVTLIGNVWYRFEFMEAEEPCEVNQD